MKEGLPPEFLIEGSSINVKFLENKMVEITAGEYLLAIAEIKNFVSKLGRVCYLLLVVIF